MSSHSMYDADRVTHLKIVVVALVCATVVAGVGIAARGTGSTTTGVITAGKQELVPMVRAGKPVVVGDQAASTIR